MNYEYECSNKLGKEGLVTVAFKGIYSPEFSHILSQFAYILHISLLFITSCLGKDWNFILDSRSSPYAIGYRCKCTPHTKLRVHFPTTCRLIFT